MNSSKRLGHLFFGSFEHPLPSPYVVYFLALVCGAGAILFSAQVIGLAKQTERLKQQEATLEAKMWEFEQQKQQFPTLEADFRKTSVELQVSTSKLETQNLKLKRAEDQLAGKTSIFDDLNKKNELLAKNNTQLSGEQARLELELDRLAKLQPQVKEMEARRDALDSEITKLETKKGELTGVVTAKSKELEVLQAAQTQIAAVNDKIDTAATSFNSILEQLKGKEADLANLVKELKTSNDSSATHLKALSASVSDFNSKVGALDEPTDKLNSQSTALLKSVTSLTATASNSETLLPKIDSLVTHKIPSMEQTILDLFKRQEMPLNSIVERLQKLESSSETAAKAFSTSVSDFNAKVGALDEPTTRLSNQSTALLNSVTSLDAAAANARTLLPLIESLISNKIPSIEKAILELPKRQELPLNSIVERLQKLETNSETAANSESVKLQELLNELITQRAKLSEMSEKLNVSGGTPTTVPSGDNPIGSAGLVVGNEIQKGGN